MIRPDARRTLDELHDEWETCTKCELGQRRISLKQPFVAGEGSRGTIMFVGEGPGEQEENEGRPFVGRSGSILRELMDRLRFNHYYLTNLVTCRSCEPVLDEAGTPRLRKRGKFMLPMLRDQPPTPPQWRMCLDRLHEEIYLVDPVIIVSLGNTAAEALMGHAVTITRDRGKEVTIQVPGAGFDAALTEKKHVWYRKVGGEVIAPVTQRMVDYLMIPTLHPAFVARKLEDRHPIHSPFAQFTNDLRKAISVYEMYMQEVYNQASTIERPTYDQLLTAI
jgi:uracil-DNA glycosylase